MSMMIESMESRVLLTATVAVVKADLAAATATVVTAKADLKAAITGAALDVKALKSDVKGVHLTKVEKVGLALIEKTVTVDAAKYNSKISALIKAGEVRAIQLEGLLKILSVHPTNVGIQTKVAVALVKLQGVFSDTVISTLESNASSVVSFVDSELNALTVIVPSTESTVAATESGLATDLTTLSTDATAIQGAISTLATDLA